MPTIKKPPASTFQLAQPPKRATVVTRDGSLIELPIYISSMNNREYVCCSICCEFICNGVGGKSLAAHQEARICVITAEKRLYREEKAKADVALHGLQETVSTINAQSKFN